jgi:uncharacterized protein
MPDIIKEILKLIPEGKVSEAAFEGANIVLYTKDKKFFLDNGGMIKDIVNQIKKRIELRPDPSICMEIEKAKAKIQKIIDKEAGITNIIFDAQRSKVIIESEKPGVAIGKRGELLTEIREKTLWVPVIRRTPPIKSVLIENIRGVLYENSEYRRKFLDKVGHRIYDGWIREKKSEWVRLSVLGGGRQVGRSCMLLQTPESRVLLDCGVDVAASDKDAYPFLDAPEFNIRELDAVIISHSHLDHCGFVPYLFKYGFRGPVYCTKPTRDVSALLLLDYVKIMRSENKKALFDQDDIKEMVKHTITLEYEEVTDITPDLRITLYNAGHVMGSSMVHLHIGNGLHNLLYTGDMKFGRTQLLNPASTVFPRLETLMIESTYGGKEDALPNRTECEDELGRIIETTLKRKGKVLIPVLGVGRAQEVLVLVEKMMKERRIPKVPVIIDGMVWDVTAIHTTYPEFLNRTLKKLIFHKDTNPFLAAEFKRIGSQKERMTVIEEGGPCIIMATSGMLVGGPSVEYLRHLGDNPKNSLVFVCYQGAGSLGRRIQRGEREIIMSANGTNQEMLNVKLEVHTISGLTGHSGRNELINFIQRCNPRPNKVIMNHGENSKVLNLTSSLHKRFRVETIAPRNLEAVRLK